MSEIPDDFTGLVRLFPLPNVVLFPHVILPLHIFEPRYCDLLHDALSHDKLITMALLRADWEKTYEARPSIHSVVCVGRILTHARLPDDRYNVLLQGVSRARIVQELPADTRYRRAHVTLLDDVTAAMQSDQRGPRHAKLIELFKQFLPPSHEFEQQLDQLLGRPLDLGLLTDLIAYTIQLPIEMKQQLLQDTNVDSRAQVLIELLETNLAKQRASDDSACSDRPHFPPPFSAN
jgi:uncharacterized protein